MNIYLTSGTPEFMEKVKQKYANEAIFLMHGGGNSVLLHETERKTVFQTPRRYEVIGASGTLEEEGYFVFNNIPVTDEGKPVFENRFLERPGTIDSEPGFIAFRLLRPLDSDTYIVLTQWTDASYYDRWKNSAAFKNSHFAERPEAGVANTLHIFSSAPYITTYKYKKKEEQA